MVQSVHQNSTEYDNNEEMLQGWELDKKTETKM